MPSKLDSLKPEFHHQAPAGNLLRQRRYVPKPRVGLRHEGLPWVRRHTPSNPNGVVSCGGCAMPPATERRHGRNPVGVEWFGTPMTQGSVAPRRNPGLWDTTPLGLDSISKNHGLGGIELARLSVNTEVVCRVLTLILRIFNRVPLFSDMTESEFSRIFSSVEGRGPRFQT